MIQFKCYLRNILIGLFCHLYILPEIVIAFPDGVSKSAVHITSIVDDCLLKGNNKVLTIDELSATLIYWSEEWDGYNMRTYFKNHKYKYPELNTTFYNIAHQLINCTFIIKPRTQGANGRYKELLFFFWHEINKLYDEDKLWYPKGAPAWVNDTMKEELIRVCKPSVGGKDCTIKGCVQVEIDGVKQSRCVAKTNNVKEKVVTYTANPITVRILMLGTTFKTEKQPSIENAGGTTVATEVDVLVPDPNSFPIPVINIDITRLYAGPCEFDEQFYCAEAGVCINKKLRCDGMWNCPKRDPSTGTRDDSKECSPDSLSPRKSIHAQDPAAILQFAIWATIAAILGVLLLYLILNWCFWRPGYLIWRCARLRNCCGRACPGSKNCGKCCTRGWCSRSCMCCKTPIMPGNKVSPMANDWGFGTGDGFHLRENR